jgi:hypothetical protein
LDNTARIFNDPFSVTERLYELGIPAEGLRYALEYGYRQSAQCTANDPPMAPGWIAWSKSIRGLRDWFIPLGWVKTDSRNYPRVIHPSGELAITVVSGDASVGSSENTPVTRSPHGPATRDAVSANQMSFLDVDPDFGPLPVSAMEDLIRQTWFLLHFYDKPAGVIRCELSLANQVSNDGYITSWQERLLLEDIPFDGMGGGVSLSPFGGPDGGVGDTGDIDVPVNRRVS